MFLILLIVQTVFADWFDIINTFEDPGVTLNQFVVDYSTDKLYLGAVNNIYELSPDLHKLRHIVTGPVLDSKQCSFECDDSTLNLTDNYNKVLLVDEVHGRLISCGSVFQGMCSVHSLKNMNIARDVPTAVVANDPAASTVAFLAPGPPDPTTTLVMYTAVSFTGSLWLRYNIPAVSSRSLEPHRMFDIAKTFCEFCQSDQVSGTRMFINTLYREEYIVNYVYGFSSGGFSYFLTNQRTPAGEYHSKIIRICHHDEQYKSYTETPLLCGDDDVFNLVVAAAVTKPDEDLAIALDVSTEDDVLYTVFRKDDNPANMTDKRSALCIFTLRNINTIIGENIEKCFRGEGMRGLDHVLPNRKCVAHAMRGNGSDHCGSNVNSPFGGETPIKAWHIAKFRAKVTSVAVGFIDYEGVLFVGTEKGYVSVLLIKNIIGAITYIDLNVDKSPITGLILDTRQANLYVMSSHRVFRVSINSIYGLPMFIPIFENDGDISYHGFRRL